MSVCVCIYIYIHTHTHTHIYIKLYKDLLWFEILFDAVTSLVLQSTSVHNIQKNSTRMEQT